jgi:hypothetical protein
VRREHPMKSRQMHPGRRHQRGKPRHQIQFSGSSNSRAGRFAREPSGIDHGSRRSRRSPRRRTNDGRQISAASGRAVMAGRAWLL